MWSLGDVWTTDTKFGSHQSGGSKRVRSTDELTQGEIRRLGMLPLEDRSDHNSFLSESAAPFSPALGTPGPQPGGCLLSQLPVLQAPQHGKVSFVSGLGYLV